MRTLAEQLAQRPIDSAELDEVVDELRQVVRAARLRELRQARDLTQAELARDLHVGQNRVSQIESGNLDTTKVETLRRYVEALGGTLTVEATFGDTKYVVA